ncbi:exopolysaccharide biosynthesis polyprenyl glycosylphosphotransferase [Flavobacterium gelidilacus]|uniref:exopolysaccharide biosynthesis polyprenyl glycosylphosphotransferase n=1 Tax=Flavobacterium gelidilacus TaxID=206041 RepID=UPI000421839E|nr:exopolysaccharide biosynthesis polyprenyl glycosylphosphotransferase [Flavobacterium gelidilacus]
MKIKKKIHFEISERKILLRIIDVLFVLISLYILGEVFNFSYFHLDFSNFYWTIVLALYLNFFGTIFELYNLQVASNQYQMVRSIILTTSSTVLFYLLTPIFTPTLPENRTQIIYFYFAILVALLIWRFLYLKLFASNRFIKRVLFVCDSKSLNRMADDLTKVNPHYQVIGFVASHLEHENKSSYYKIPFEEFEEFIYQNRLTEIVIAFKKKDEISVGLYEKLLNLLEEGVIIREYDQVYEASTNRLPVAYLSKDFYKYFPFSRSNQNKFYLTFTRVFDVIFSLLGISIGLLILPLILIFNLIWNRGSLFYTQDRVGKNNKPFTIYKLRTMVKDAEKDGAVFATTNDTRITPLGKFLRKSRLDEVPQFINVLKGEMSIIGPRPERPIFVNQIAEKLPFYQTRHVIKPGLTGWAQVNHSYTDTIDDALIKLQYDLFYIKHRSIFLDINILIKTIGTVLFYKGQ